MKILEILDSLCLMHNFLTVIVVPTSQGPFWFVERQYTDQGE